MTWYTDVEAAEGRLQGEMDLKKPSVLRIIAASIVAALLGLVQPLFFMSAFMICLTPIALTALYAWAGWIPVVIGSAGTVGTISWFAGISGGMPPVLAGASAAIVFVLPALVAIVAQNRRIPFFRRMAATIAVQTAALLGFACMVYLGMKVDLVDALADMMRSSMEAASTETLVSCLNMFAMYGILNEESIEGLTTGFVLWSDVRNALDQAFDLIRYQLRQTMPALLLNSGLISGVLLAAVPGRICSRRGDQPDVGYVPLTQWFLPARVTGIVALCVATGCAMQWSGVEGADAMTTVFTTIGSTLCLIQGLASIHRRFRMTGTARGVRITLTILCLMFATTFLELVGAMSALFGSKGAISTWMRKRNEENRKDDE